MQLSIIVPIYNVEEYLPRCLKSILGQTFTDFELILIDDGSQDRCGEIIDEYAKIDSRIVVVHQDNMGVSAARNAGVRIAKGVHIGFVDSDDYIAPDYYETMLALMEKYDAQLGICNFMNVSSFKMPEAQEEPADFQLMSQGKTAEALFHVPPIIYGSVANKVFLRSKITKLFDIEARLCEDNLFLLNYILNIEKTIWVKAPFYFVFSRPDSATRAANQSFVESLPVRKNMCMIVKSAPFYDVYEAAFHQYFDSCISILLRQPKKTKLKRIVRKRIISEIPVMLLNKKISLKQKLAYIYMSVTK